MKYYVLICFSAYRDKKTQLKTKSDPTDTLNLIRLFLPIYRLIIKNIQFFDAGEYKCSNIIKVILQLCAIYTLTQTHLHTYTYTHNSVFAKESGGNSPLNSVSDSQMKLNYKINVFVSVRV